LDAGFGLARRLERLVNGLAEAASLLATEVVMMESTRNHKGAQKTAGRRMVRWMAAGVIFCMAAAWAAAGQDPRVRREMQEAPAQIASSSRIAPADEPGEQMVIEGTVLMPDGKPAAGVTVYAYHTDATGHYVKEGPGPGAANFTPRLRAWVKTDAGGHFEWQTIRPAPYPNREVPAHIHITAWGAGLPVQWFEVQFAGDPLLAKQHFTDNTADFLYIVPLEKQNAVWRGKLELKMKTESNFKSQ
jgi:protocatechuate 3,4-dioxygenase beta subunit